MTYDLLVIGSGPAGVTAAIYACRAKKSVLVIEKEAFGGMITHSPKVENYPGFNSISGLELADKFVAQAMDLNVSFEFENVLEIIKDEDTFKVKCEGHLYEGKSVIIATGSKHRELKLEKEKILGWLEKGATPSDTVRSILSHEGILKEFADKKASK